LVKLNKALKPCSLKKAVKHAWFSPNPFDRITQLMPQMREIQAADIAQLDPLELFPEALAWIEFRGIGRQALQVHPLGCTVGQERLDAMTAMNGSAIPDDDHTAGDFPQQMLQKGDHVV
jgi:hypothetical protein